jgi:hypothetical protein
MSEDTNIVSEEKEVEINLKTILVDFKYDMNRDKEPLDKLEQITSFVNGLIQDPEFFKKEADVKYFYGDFICGVLKSLLRTTHCKNPEVSIN